MPKMPKEYDPFEQSNVYDELELDPYADADTVNETLQKFAAKLEKMPDSEKDDAMATFQMAMKKLKNSKNRIHLNVLIPDPYDERLLKKQLETAMDELSVGNLEMPSKDVSSILIEGDLEEFAIDDLHEIEPIEELVVDIDKLREELKKEPVPRYISFET